MLGHAPAAQESVPAPPDEAGSPFIPIAEAAREVRVHPSTLYRNRKAWGLTLKKYPTGSGGGQRTWVLRNEAFEQLLEERRAHPTG